MKHRNLFFSRDDDYSLGLLNEMFTPKDNIVWFVEHKASGKWITEDSNHCCLDWNFPTPHNPNGLFVIQGGIKMKRLYDSPQLTNEPLKAKQFKIQSNALAYCCVNKLGEEFITTEHEFL